MLISLLLLIVALFMIVLLVLSGRDRHVLTARLQTFSYEGQDRRFLLSKPSYINKDSKLVIGLHGFGDSPMRFAYYTGLHNAADKNDLVVYPQASTPTQAGQKPGWNAGFCCGSGWKNGVDDVGFITELAKSLAAEYGIKNTELYVTGFSNGAFMTQRLATEKPNIFRAFAARSGSIGTIDKQLEPKEPVPILLSHGVLDKTVPFYGGVGGSDPDFTWQSFEQTTDAWEKNNGEQASVEVLVDANEAHSWHDWRLFNVWHRVPQGSRDVIEFFGKY